MATKPTNTQVQYVDGLKITSKNFSQRENRWNQIDYSWYHLKKAYGISSYFTMEFSADIARKYTARGLYCQEAPYEQSILITCTEGCIVLFVLDLREDSCTYLMHNRLVLDASLEVCRSIYIPRGVAYGFVTLEDNTRINFKADNYCEKSFEKIYNMLDPQFGMSVPYPDKTGSSASLTSLLSKGELLMSAQDRSAPWIIDVVDVEDIELNVRGGEIDIEDVVFSEDNEESVTDEAENNLKEAKSNKATPSEMDADKAAAEPDKATNRRKTRTHS